MFYGIAATIVPKLNGQEMSQGSKNKGTFGIMVSYISLKKTKG